MTILRANLQLIAGWLWIDADDQKWLALIVGAALIIRVVWVLVILPTPIRDAAEYDNLAWRLANGQAYVTGDGTPTTLLLFCPSGIQPSYR